MVQLSVQLQVRICWVGSSILLLSVVLWSKCRFTSPTAKSGLTGEWRDLNLKAERSAQSLRSASFHVFQNLPSNHVFNP